MQAGVCLQLLKPLKQLLLAAPVLGCFAVPRRRARSLMLLLGLLSLSDMLSCRCVLLDSIMLLSSDNMLRSVCLLLGCTLLSCISLLLYVTLLSCVVLRCMLLCNHVCTFKQLVAITQDRVVVRHLSVSKEGKSACCNCALKQKRT